MVNWVDFVYSEINYAINILICIANLVIHFQLKHLYFVDNKIKSIKNIYIKL